MILINICVHMKNGRAILILERWRHRYSYITMATTIKHRLQRQLLSPAFIAMTQSGRGVVCGGSSAWWRE